MIMGADSTEDRLPPHSTESEEGVLSCILQKPDTCLAQCQEVISTSEIFYNLRLRIIYDTLVELGADGHGLDVLTLHQALKDKQQLEEVGGLDYIAGLPDKAASTANLECYLETLRDKFLLRRMLAFCSRFPDDLHKNEGEVEALAARFASEAMAIGEQREARLLPIKEVVHTVINRIEENHVRGGKLPGIPTGLTDLDKLTLGLQPEDYIVFGARASTGKTAVLLNIADHIAVEQKIPVGIFSLEMSAESLVLRMLCSRARVNAQLVREGYLVDRDFPRITGAAGRLANAPIYIDDTGGLSSTQLRARARRMVQQHGIKVFGIDYLQLLRGRKARYSNRQEEVADISQDVKAMTKELGVPVIVLAQLSREFEKDKNRKPRMSDLRESGAIEQDADIIGLLYKPNQEDEDQAPSETVPVNLLLAKHRNGPTGEVNLTFLKQFTKFENAARIDHEPGAV